MMIFALVNRDEISSSQIEPPLITASVEPLKRRPDQPGGMQIPNRDKMVFDLLDSSSSTLDVTASTQVDEDALDEVPAVEPVVVAPVVSETKLETVVSPVVKPVEVVTPAVVKTADIVVEKPKVEEKKMVEVIKVKEAPKADIKPEPKPVSGGKWGVQLAAVNTVEDGNAFAAKASKDFAALKGLSAKISPVPGGGKYRVQFVGVANRDAAVEVCNKLKGKQGCFPIGGQ